MMGFGYGHDGWSSTGMLFMGVFLIALVAVAVWAVARLSGNSNEPSCSLESPRQILDRRFASGDIDEEQYALARRVLQSRSVDEARR
jgi:putative membrane protein